MGKIRKLHLTIWMKYAATYLLVLAIPLFAFRAYFDWYANRETQKNIQELLNNNLLYIMKNFDRKIVQMNKISEQIAKNQYFRQPNSNEYSYVRRKGIQDTLVHVAASDFFFNDIFFYQSSSPYLLFSTTGTRLTSFYRTFKNGVGGFSTLDQLSRKDFPVGIISSSDTAPGIIPHDEVIIYSYPLRELRDSYLLFEIKENRLQEMFSPIETDGKVSICYHDHQLYPFNEENSELHETDEAYQCSQTSEITNLKYTYTARRDTITTMAQNMLKGFMELSVILSFACLTLVVILSKKHARPLEQLVTLSKDFASKNTSGIAQIESAMNCLQSRSLELDRLRLSSMQEHVLIRLVRGKYQDENEAQENLQRIHITFRQPYRLIMILQMKSDETKHEMVDVLIERLSNHHDLYSFSYTEQSAFVMLVGLNHENREELAEELVRLSKSPEFSDVWLHFSIGKSFSNFTDARESFMQAFSSSRRSLSSTVTLYQENDSKKIFHPKEELQAFETALKNQDRNQVIFLHDILISARENSHLYFYTVSLLSKMIFAYLQMLHANNAYISEENDCYSDFLKNAPIHNIEDMFDALENLHHLSLQCMTKNELNKPYIEMTGIANYISALDKWDTLTVTSIAERFGMSVSSLSHKFKEEMGCNISDYILACKINHACLMLRSTDMTIAEIAEQIGYCRYTSFVRAFKQEKGITPSAYRSGWRDNVQKNSSF